MNFIFKSEIIEYDFINNGHEKTILFLHGWGGNKDSFISTINLLKHKYNILTLTLPTTSPTITEWNMFDYVNVVHQILTTHNIFRFSIICHSFGFRITSLMNGRFNVDKIIITGGAGLKKSNFYRKIIKNNQILLLKSAKFRFLYEKIASRDYIQLSPINQKSFKNIVNLNTKNFIKFSCPIMLYWGKNDTATPLWIAKTIKRSNNATLILTNGDHFAYLNDSEYFNNQVMEFLK